MTTLRLFNYWRSSASWRVRIGLGLKGLKYEYVSVHLVREGGEQKSEEYLAKNPMAQVPTLEVTDDSGATRRITQSLAILEWLDEAYPEPAILPRDQMARADARRLAEIVNSGIQPLQNLEVQRYIRDELKGDAAEFTRYFVARGIVALEAEARGTAGLFLVGDRVSIADCCLVPQLYACRRFGVELTGCGTLLGVESRMLEIEAVRLSAPEHQPDAQKT